MEEERDRLKQETADIEEEDVIRETTLNGEIKPLIDKLKKITDNIAELQLDVLQLEESFKKQSCSYQEKLTLLKTIDSLKEDVRIKTEKFEHAQKLEQEFNITLSEELTKVITFLF